LPLRRASFAYGYYPIGSPIAVMVMIVATMIVIVAVVIISAMYTPMNSAVMAIGVGHRLVHG
jgi:hypothetical protein